MECFRSVYRTLLAWTSSPCYGSGSMEHFKMLDDVCAVCTDPFEKDQELTRLSCGHMYHRVCLREWFTVRQTCPLCSTDYGRRYLYEHAIADLLLC